MALTRLTLVPGVPTRVALLLLIYVVAYFASFAIGLVAVSRAGDEGLLNPSAFAFRPLTAHRISTRPIGMRVDYVEIGSPAADAGLREGDVILAINGAAADGGPAFIRQFFASRAYAEETLVVEPNSGPRSGQNETLTFRLRSRIVAPTVAPVFLVFFFIGFFTVAVVSMVVRLRPRDPVTLTMMTSIGLSSFILNCLLWFFQTGVDVRIEVVFDLLVALFSVRSLYLYLSFPVVHPLLSYLRRLGPPALQRRGLGESLLYVPALLVFLVRHPNSAFSTDFLTAGGAISGLYLLLATVVALHTYVRYANPVARAQIRWIFWAWIVWTIVVAVGPVPYVLSGGAIDIPRLPPPYEAGDLILWMLAWVVNPIALGMAVLRYRLFEVDRLARATISYSLIVAVALVSYVMLVILVAAAITLTIGESNLEGDIARVFVPLTIALGIRPTARWIEAVVDRIIYRDPQRRLAFLAEATERLQEVHSFDRLRELLTVQAKEQLDLQAAWLAFPPLGGEVVDHDVTPELITYFRDSRRPTVIVERGDLAPGPLADTIPAEHPVIAKWAARGAFLVIPLVVDVPHGSEIAHPLGVVQHGADEDSSRDRLLVGLWILAHHNSGDILDVEDLKMLQRVARSAAVTLGYIQLHRRALQQEIVRREIAQARAIQNDLLPEQIPLTSSFIEASVRFSPAGEMSGDFYDIVEVRDPSVSGGTAPVHLVLGDVVGKGIPAAFIMAIAQTVLRAFALDDPHFTSEHGPIETLRSPATTLYNVNGLLHRYTGLKRFVTCSLAFIEPRSEARPSRLYLANAGLIPPILCRDGKVTELVPEGDSRPIGIVSSPTYRDLVVDLQPGDVVVFATDGLIEAAINENNSPQQLLGQPRVPRTIYGFERFHRSVRRWAGTDESIQRIANGIWDDVHNWIGEAPRQDDMTLMVLRVREN